MMNLNKGCIEIGGTDPGAVGLKRWTLTRVVLKFGMKSTSFIRFFMDEP